MEALITVPELEEAVPFDMDEADLREANNACESLSDDARYYGKDAWTDPDRAPRQVKRLVLKAAVRYMKNYEGHTTSRAGDEAVGWTDRGEGAGSPEFTQAEIKQLKKMGGQHRQGFHSVSLTQGTGERHRYVGSDRVGIHDPAILVPVEGPYTAKPFPYGDPREPL